MISLRTNTITRLLKEIITYRLNNSRRYNIRHHRRISTVALSGVPVRSRISSRHPVCEPWVSGSYLVRMTCRVTRGNHLSWLSLLLVSSWRKMKSCSLVALTIKIYENVFLRNGSHLLKMYQDFQKNFPRKTEPE